MCRGSSGLATRRSTAMKPISSTTLAASDTIVAVLDHELVSALEKP